MAPLEHAEFALPTPLASFQQLSPNLYLYEPKEPHPKTDTTSPTTILFFTWMDALPKHYSKYVAKHMILYPHARIIIATLSFREFLFQSEAQRRTDMIPGVKVLQEAAAAAASSGEERILAHVMSNAGGKRLFAFAAEYRERTGTVLPLRALVMDSAPGGIAHISKETHVVMQMMSGPLRWLWYPVAWLFAVIVWLVVNLGLAPDIATNPRKSLNDDGLINSFAVRAYIYCEEDKIISYIDVLSHAEEAKTKGYPVIVERFSETEHVTHMRADPDRYWGIVQDVWRQGVKF